MADRPRTTQQAKSVSVFLASPTLDTWAARQEVVKVVREIAADPLYARHIRLELWRWDDPARPVICDRGGNPQEDIIQQVGSPADADLVIGLFANTMGGTLPVDRFPLPAGRSEPWHCAEWEVEQGLLAAKSVWVFHDQRPPGSKKREVLQAASAVSAFIDRFNPPDGPQREGFNPFEDEADLASKLRPGLRSWLSRIIDQLSQQGPSGQDDLHPLPGLDQNEGSRAEFDWPAFHAQQKERLLDCSDGFVGPFAASLWKHLRKQFRGIARQAVPTPEAVAECFAMAPDEKVDALFFALQQARAEAGRLSADEVDLLVELLVYASMRGLDPTLWAGSVRWLGEPGNLHARVHELPTASSLLAAMGYAGLHGLVLRSGPGTAPEGVFDLSEVALNTEVADSVLRALYDEAFKARPPRPNPLCALSKAEVGQLRDHFDQLRLGGHSVTVYVRLPTTLDSQAVLAVLTEVARAINNRVVQGSERDAPDLTLPQTNLTCASLEAKIRDILSHTRSRGPDDPPAGSRVPTAPPPPPRPPVPDYRYDLFVSHASEDKAGLVDGLVAALKAAGVTVWYDKERLTMGDSISAAINQALVECRFGLVVYSPHFLGKNWPMAEQQALFSLSLQSGKKRLLPILHGVTVEELSRRLPLLADRLFCDSRVGLRQLVKQILNAID